MRVTGLDLSLTGTGVCTIAGTERVLVGFATVGARGKQDDPLEARSVRLRSLVARLWNHTAGADLVVVEGPSYASQTGHLHDRSGLWWLMVGRLTGAGVPVVEVPPSTVKTYATGKGNANKDQVLAAVIRRYFDDPPADNNQADALVLAAMGRRWGGRPIESLPQANLLAMRKVAWPPNLPRGQADG